MSGCRLLIGATLVLLFICRLSISQTSFSVSNKTTGDTLLTIDSAGRVGIHTTEPGATLDILSFNPDNNAVFRIGNSDKSHYLNFYSGRLTYPDPMIMWSGGDALRFGTSFNSTNEYMRLTSGGNLGIGIADPATRLDVSGAIRISAAETLPDRANYALYMCGWPGDGVDIGKIFVGDNTGWKFHFSNRIDNTDTDLMTIQDNGNVGIGTINPSELLEVNGTVYSSDGGFRFPDNSIQTTAASANGNTLDQAYDAGSPGAGRIITADAGAVTVSGRDGFMSTGVAIGVGDIPATGAGIRMMWYPAHAAFRAGSVGSLSWSADSIGLYSIAAGDNTTAVGIGSSAFGAATRAGGSYSTATGILTRASGANSMAMGYYTKASGISAVSMGYNTTASGAYSIASGGTTTASGDYSVAIGQGIEVSGDHSVAIALSDQSAVDVSQNSTLAIMGGYVGIGTATPGTALEVADVIYSSVGGFKFPDGTVQETAASAEGAQWAGDTDIYYNDGNVGIGTDAPLTRLHVEDVDISLENTALLNELVTVEDNDAGLGLYSDNNGGYGSALALGEIVSGALTNKWSLFRTTSGASQANQLQLSFGSDPSYAINPALWALNPDGRMGIGTTDPWAGLHLKGEQYPNSFLFIEAGTGYDSGIRLYEGLTPQWHLFNNATLGGLQVYNSDGGHTVFFADQSTGNVGIGTTSPATNLHVAGDMGVTIDGDLIVGAGSATDLDIIRFDDSDEALYWNETEDRFEFSDDLAVVGALSTGSGASAVNYNRMGVGTPASGVITGSNSLFISGNLEVGTDIYAQDDIVVQGEIVGTTAISSSAITDEPGVASRAEDWFYVVLGEGDGVDQLLSRTITIPAPGYVLVLGTCEFRYLTVGWQYVDAVFGVSDVSSDFPPNQTFPIHISSAAQSCEFPISVHGLFNIETAGAHTFYFLGENTSDTDGHVSIVIGDIQFTLVYIPTAYGPVQATNNESMLSTSLDGKPSRSGLTDGEIAQEQAEAKSFDAERLENELELLKQKIAEMENRLNAAEKYE